MHKSHFGVVIKLLRLQQGLTQEQLASRSDLERTFVSMLERGIKQPSLNTISNIANAFGIKNYELLHLVEQEIHGDTFACRDAYAENELSQLAALESEHEKARIDEIVNAMPIVFFARTPMPEYAATFVSKNIKQLLGYEREQFTHQHHLWLEILHPEDRASVLDRIERMSANTLLNHEYRILAADGQWRLVREELKLVMDASGATKEVLGSMTGE